MNGLQIASYVMDAAALVLILLTVRMNRRTKRTLDATYQRIKAANQRLDRVNTAMDCAMSAAQSRTPPNK